MSVIIAEKIQKNPKYLQLVGQRNMLGWILTAVVLVMYFSFILMIAYAPGILTAPISADSVIPQGMFIGVGIILASCVTTGIYVYVANNKFDSMVHEIVEEASK